jgi:hypothetical protein
MGDRAEITAVFHAPLACLPEENSLVDWDVVM